MATPTHRPLHYTPESRSDLLKSTLQYRLMSDPKFSRYRENWERTMSGPDIVVGSSMAYGERLKLEEAQRAAAQRAAEMAQTRMQMQLRISRNLDENRAAIEASKFSAREIEGRAAQSIGERRAKILSNISKSATARRASGFQRYLLTEEGVAKSPDKSADENKRNEREQANIASGIHKALGGKKLKFLRDIFGYGFGYGHIIRDVFKFVVGSSIQRSMAAQGTMLSALASGSTFQSVRALGRTVRAFGGSENDATKLLSSMTRFKAGPLMGIGFGDMLPLMKYGARIHPMMSEEEMIKEIADTYKELPERFGKQRGMELRMLMAQEGNIPVSFLPLFEKGGDATLERIAKERERAAKNEETQLKQAEALQNLSIQWEIFLDKSAPTLTDILNGLSRLIELITPGDKDADESMLESPLGKGLQDAGSILVPSSGTGQYKSNYDWASDALRGRMIPIDVQSGTGGTSPTVYNITVPADRTDAESLAKDIAEIVAQHDRDGIINYIFGQSIGITQGVA